MTPPTARLILDDGTTYEGVAIGGEGTAFGRLIFHTAMTGFQEILSCPSYAEQIVVFTQPHIGNTGVNDEDMESNAPTVSGFVVREEPCESFHYRRQARFVDWLVKERIVAIAGVDTRALTLKIRHKPYDACITTELDATSAAVQLDAWRARKRAPLAQAVSTKRRCSFPAMTPARAHIVVYDCGVKRSFVQKLQQWGADVTLIPYGETLEDILALAPDGVILSSGPGDPAQLEVAIRMIRGLLSHAIPVMGICLGHQLLAHAIGATTLEMPFGHHGANHPVVIDNDEKHYVISSQNHGFRVDEKSLPSDWKVWSRSLFDGTIQGIAHREKPFIGFQGHPEASPGPHDLEHIFDLFFDMMAG